MTDFSDLTKLNPTQLEKPRDNLFCSTEPKRLRNWQQQTPLTAAGKSGFKVSLRSRDTQMIFPFLLSYGPAPLAIQERWDTYGLH